MAVNENTLEQAIISELQDKGYEYLYGPEIERDYHNVILENTIGKVLSELIRKSRLKLLMNHIKR